MVAEADRESTKAGASGATLTAVTAVRAPPKRSPCLAMSAAGMAGQRQSGGRGNRDVTRRRRRSMDDSFRPPVCRYRVTPAARLSTAAPTQQIPTACIGRERAHLRNRRRPRWNHPPTSHALTARTSARLGYTGAIRSPLPHTHDVNRLIARIHERYRYPLIILRAMVVTDFKLRYQGSLLGYLWTLLRPFAIFTILYIVFAGSCGWGHPSPTTPSTCCSASCGGGSSPRPRRRG